MDRDQTRQREQYQGERFEEESPYRQGGERAMTYPSQDRQRQGGQSGMERSGPTSSDMTTSSETGGNWQGFVVPYRYYGPGYAGLGYYAVYYQGGEGQRGEGGTSQGIDQRNVGQSQGQSVGAGWGPGRSSGGQTGRYGGQSQSQRGQWQSQSGQGTSQGGEWGRSAGGYAGRGPKGYRRSDERIREEISDQFMDNDELDASDIEVMVVEGVVTLTGTVPDRQSKRLAEDIAENGSGVRDVMNQLKVDNQGRSRGGQQSDANGRRGSGAASSGSASRSGTGSSSGTKSTASPGSRSRSGKASETSSTGSTGSETRQPVGAATGGATDGSTGNGSNRDQSTRNSGGQAR